MSRVARGDACRVPAACRTAGRARDLRDLRRVRLVRERARDRRFQGGRGDVLHDGAQPGRRRRPRVSPRGSPADLEGIPQRACRGVSEARTASHRRAPDRLAAVCRHRRTAGRRSGPALLRKVVHLPGAGGAVRLAVRDQWVPVVQRVAADGGVSRRVPLRQRAIRRDRRTPAGRRLRLCVRGARLFFVDRARALQLFARAAGVFFLAAQTQRHTRRFREPVGARSAQRWHCGRLVRHSDVLKGDERPPAAADARVARLASAMASGARDHGDLRRRDTGALRDQHDGHRRLELSGRGTEHVLHRRRLPVSDARQDIRRRQSARAQRGPGRRDSRSRRVLVEPVGECRLLRRRPLRGDSSPTSSRRWSRQSCSWPRPGGGRRGNGSSSLASSCRC